MSRIPDFANIAFKAVAVPQPSGSAEPWLTPEGIPVKPAYGEGDLAGRPGELEAGLREAGVADFVVAGGDALVVLQKAYELTERT